MSKSNGPIKITAVTNFPQIKPGNNISKLIADSISNNDSVKADFLDGYKCQQVLDAASTSAAESRWIEII